MNSTVVCTRCGAMSVDECSCVSFGGTKKNWPPTCSDQAKELIRVNELNETLQKQNASLFADKEERGRVANDLQAQLCDIEKLPPAFQNAKASDTYEGLLKQFNAMKGWATSQQKQVKYYRDIDYKHSREMMMANSDNLNALRDENAQLTDSLLAAEDKIEGVNKIKAEAVREFKSDSITRAGLGPMVVQLGCGTQIHNTWLSFAEEYATQLEGSDV